MASVLKLFSRRHVAVRHLDLAAPPPSPLPQLPTFPLHLTQRLPNLSSSSGPAHLSWLLDAVSASLSTLSSLSSPLISTSPFPAAPLLPCKHQLPLPQQRADEIVGLLDVCYALKQVADHLYRQVVRLDHALQSLEEALQLLPSSSSSSSSFSIASCSFSSATSSSSSSWTSSIAHQSLGTSGWRLRRGARRLSACLQNQSLSNSELNKAVAEACSSLLSARNGLKRMVPPTGITEPTGDALLTSQAMHGAALTTLLILAAALSSLAPRSKSCNHIITRSCRFMKAGLLKKTLPSWAAAMPTQLQQGLVQAEKSSTSAVFQELQELHASAATLLLGINESLGSGAIANREDQAALEVKRMLKGTQALQEGLLNFGGDMGQLFQALVDTRLGLLDAAAAAACCPQHWLH